VALFACARKFDAVIASDINPEAVHCAEANMRLFSDPRAFDERLREVRVRQNANRK
jgi:methylase of polypeptide subunit release factors